MIPDERFMRNFFRMPNGATVTSSHSITGPEVQFYCKKHLILALQNGRIIIGIRDDFTKEFLPIKSVPGSLVADHVHEKGAMRWWHLSRRWKRRASLSTPEQK